MIRLNSLFNDMRAHGRIPETAHVVRSGFHCLGLALRREIARDLIGHIDEFAPGRHAGAFSMRRARPARTP